jgi:hypothetical protein
VTVAALEESDRSSTVAADMAKDSALSLINLSTRRGLRAASHATTPASGDRDRGVGVDAEQGGHLLGCRFAGDEAASSAAATRASDCVPKKVRKAARRSAIRLA